jgi:lipopolysaccharide export system protein LptC
MTWRDKGWSRTVFWLKILLPMAALAILSTLFLLSRSVDPRNAIPFTQVEIADRIGGQQMTALSFSGASTEGHLIGFTAAAARPDPANPDRVLTESPAAVIDLITGARLTLHAAAGTVDEPADRATLTGTVRLTSSLGYEVQSELITAALTRLAVTSPGPVQGHGPPGRFTAGAMVLDSDPDNGQARLLFTGGVRLIYLPQR